MGRSKKLRLPSYLPFMKSIPAFPPGLRFRVQSCLAMERGAVGGTENQGNGLKQYWSEGKNKSQR